MNETALKADSAAPSRGLRALGWALAAAMLAFGLFSEDWASRTWGAVTVAVFGLPLLLQAARSAQWRVNGLWFGLFVLAQSLITPLLRGNYVALPPGMKASVKVGTDSIPGYARGVRQISTDERGWRVQPPVDYSSKQGLRVVAIGGSTTEDIMLDDRATWTHRLQQALASDWPGVHVINTGLSGLRAANHVATLQVVAPLKPDLVLILLGGNDWNRHIRLHHEPGFDAWKPLPFRVTALPRVLDSLVISPLRRSSGGTSWADTSRKIDGPQDFAPGRSRHSDRQPRHSFLPQAVAPAYAAEVQSLGVLCREERLRCLFLTQPHAYGPPPPPADLEALFWMTPPYASYGLDLPSMVHIAQLYRQHLKDFAAREGHGLCDLAAGMPPQRELYYDDMHFTDLGAQRVADLVRPCVGALLGPGVGR